MGGTTPELKTLALGFVGQHQPCRPNVLVRTLKQHGASVRAANETWLQLLRDGYLRRTWNGKLKLP